MRSAVVLMLSCPIAVTATTTADPLYSSRLSHITPILNTTRTAHEHSSSVATLSSSLSTANCSTEASRTAVYVPSPSLVAPISTSSLFVSRPATTNCTIGTATTTVYVAPTAQMHSHTTCTPTTYALVPLPARPSLNWNYTNIISGTGATSPASGVSRGYAVPSLVHNSTATYHPPTLMASETSSGSSGSVFIPVTSTAQGQSPVVPTTTPSSSPAKSALPTPAQPSEPLFTGGAATIKATAFGSIVLGLVAALL